MKTLTKTALVAISIIGLGAVSTAAYAADPVDLSTGDTIYQASYSDEPALLWTTASDGSATLVGTPATMDLFDVTDGAWDPTTGKSYVIGNGYEGPCELWEADTTTGLFTFITDITVPDPEEPTENCDAFDIAPDGTAWITIFNGGVLAKLDLSTGATSDHVTITGDNDGSSWIAIQPTTGVVFLGDWNDVLYTIVPATGVTTFVSAFAEDLDPGWYDAAFDASGRAWITGWQEDTALYSADLDNFDATFVQQGAILLDGSGEETGTDSIWIERAAAPAPEPVLAATGLDTAGALGAGGALLLLGFGAFAVARLRRA